MVRVRNHIQTPGDRDSHQSMRRGSLYLEGTGMERLHRLLRLARLRGDLVAIAILETRLHGVKWTEAEKRLAWGDR